MCTRRRALRTTPCLLVNAPWARGADKLLPAAPKAPHPFFEPLVRSGQSILGLRGPVRPTSALDRLERRGREPRPSPLVGRTSTRRNFSPAVPSRFPVRTADYLWSPFHH